MHVYIYSYMYICIHRKGGYILYCIVFNHFCSAYHSMSLSEALPTTAIDAVSELTRRSATGDCKWRTYPTWRLERDSNPVPVESHRLYQFATTPHKYTRDCMGWGRCSSLYISLHEWVSFPLNCGTVLHAASLFSGPIVAWGTAGFRGMPLMMMNE